MLTSFLDNLARFILVSWVLVMLAAFSLMLYDMGMNSVILVIVLGSFIFAITRMDQIQKRKKS